MTDDITQKHLDKARVRGAPAAIPGSAGLVSSYDIDEVQRQATRALVLDLGTNAGDGFPLKSLREGHQKLSQVAAIQKLRVLEAPLLALHADPMEDVPADWQWHLLLPVRGPAKSTDDVTTGRLHGGMYVTAVTRGGFPDLDNLYAYLFGEFLPARKQQLTRPCIYHRILDGLDGHDPASLTIEAFVPIQLSLKSPLRLTSRSFT